MLSYNRVDSVPEELGNCESLEKLELAKNQDLDELPEQVPTHRTTSTDSYTQNCSHRCLQREPPEQRQAADIAAAPGVQ